MKKKWKQFVCFFDLDTESNQMQELFDTAFDSFDTTQYWVISVDILKVLRTDIRPQTLQLHFSDNILVLLLM